MQKPTLRALAAAAALALTGVAQATIIDFENITYNPSYAPSLPFVGHYDEFYQGGYWFSGYSNAAEPQAGELVGALVYGPDRDSICVGMGCPSSSGTYYAALNDGMVWMGAIGGSTFKLRGFDASFVAASGAVVPSVSLILRAQGFLATGGTMTASFLLSGPGTTGGYSFQNFDTTNASQVFSLTTRVGGITTTLSDKSLFGKTDFQQVTFFGLACDANGNCAAFGSNQGQFALDNVAAVPEPSTWGLMGLGLLALGAHARRRRAAA